MAEDLVIDRNTSKEARYQQLLPQIKALLESEEDLIANLANAAAALHEAFAFLWTGFYLVRGNELVLGPFQGPVACTRIAYGKGVCGSAWAEARTLVVPDVNTFPGHIACSSMSRSEIVVPFKNTAGEVLGVLDIDSSKLGSFDAIDQSALEELCSYLSMHE